MEITLLEDFRGLAKSEKFTVKPNAVNYWMGGNGCGKSTLAGGILTFLKLKKPALVKREWWMATHVGQDKTFDMTGYEHITGITFFSDKLRQTQYVDMTSLIDMGMGRIWDSEGMNAQRDVASMVQNMNDPNHLYILDEIDGHLDYAAKVIFFELALRRIKGTAIVITHDSAFMRGTEVFDFDICKHCTGDDFYKKHLDRVLWPQGKPEDKPVIKTKKKK